MPERADPLRPALFVLVLAGALLVGLRLRLPGAPDNATTQTVFNYYFDKTQRLVLDGSFPRLETLRFAPEARPENAPPGLAFATAWAHRAANVFKPDLPLRWSANAFPLLAYALWLLCLAILLADLVGARAAAAAAVALTVVPVSVELTRYGSYFEEVLGNPLLFASACLLVKAGEEAGWRWTALAAAAMTALELTWQQFPVLYGAAALLLLLDAREPRPGGRALRFALALGVPLLAGELVGRGLLGTGYSPLSMLGEAALGIWRAHEPDLVTAMSRLDWQPTGPRELLRYFGWLGAGLTALGALRAAAGLDDRRKRSFAVFGALGLLLLAKFMKERFLALSLCLPLMALGAQALLAPAAFAVELRRARAAALSAWRRWGARAPAKPALAALGLALAGFAVRAGLRRLPGPPPKPVFRVAGLERLKLGKPGIVEVFLENAGGRAPLDEASFAGTHIEVHNAEVHRVRAQTAGRRGRVVFKHYAQAGNTFFFETKDPRLEPGETMRVTFEVTPYQLPVRVFYRGWIPGPCSARQRREAVRDLLRPWRNVRKGGWRNEACIRRLPARRDREAPLCRVEVFAAHNRLQPMRCFVASSKSILPMR